MKTIAAISTAAAPGGIGIIRISGSEARAVGDRVFRAASGETLSEAAGYTCRFGHVQDESGARLDECIATVFAAPKSFTGEDVVELSCHGGLFILKTVLQAVFAAGAAPAAPGEFTRRAFLNGKMDLAQAEAVMELISAQGREAMKAAQAGHDGALSRRIAAIRDDLTDVGAHLAAWADYPDDDIPQVDENMLKERLSAGHDALEALIRSFDGGRVLREGVVTVIAGKPNAGKSTLMNLLAGCERSIVTDLAGTTRDVVEGDGAARRDPAAPGRHGGHPRDGGPRRADRRENRARPRQDRAVRACGVRRERGAERRRPRDDGGDRRDAVRGGRQQVRPARRDRHGGDRGALPGGRDDLGAFGRRAFRAGGGGGPGAADGGAEPERRHPLHGAAARGRKGRAGVHRGGTGTRCCAA